MIKNIGRVVLAAVIGLISGVVGLLAGMLIGGNYAEQFVFNGVRGYEATGQIGLLVGAVTGWLIGVWGLFKPNTRNGGA